MLTKEQMQNLTKEQKEIINEYAKDNNKKLKNICNQIRSTSIDQADYDDLYSDAMNVLLESVVSYDQSKKASFNTFLSNNIKLSYREWCRNRYERGIRNNLKKDENGVIEKDEYGKPIPIRNVSLDDDSATDKYSLQELIPAKDDVESQVFFEDDGKFDKYLQVLGETQRKMAILMSQGYKSEEIRNILNLSEKEFNTFKKDMRNYEKIKILKRIDGEYIDEKSKNEEANEKGDEDMSELAISEKSKNMSYSIENICKKLDRRTLNDEHPLQRKSGQWNQKKKGEFISDILQGKSMLQIIISEEFKHVISDGIKTKIKMLWLIDGKQRCTVMDDFLKDGFAVFENVKRWNIPYQTNKTDENGNIVYSEEGFPIPVIKHFDIRKKKFSQFPEELQEQFKEYNFPVMFNMNCTKEEIAYDIARFNRCRPMNVAQNGWTSLDEEYAELVDGILKLDFFKTDCPKSDFKPANDKSGALRRIIVESIMISRYRESYDKDFEKICSFLSDNGDESDFLDFFVLVENLVDVLTPETAKLFNARNTSIWLALFEEFKTYGFEDKRFVDFLIEFQNNLHSFTINDITYDDIDSNTRSTKDKSVVNAKMQHLITLMKEYFGIKPEKTENDAKELTTVDERTTEENLGENNKKEESVLDFVKQNVNSETSNEDIELYQDCLDEYMKVDSPLYTNYMKPIIAMMAYACEAEKDEEFGNWVKRHENAGNSFGHDQKEAYNRMLIDFSKFLQNSQTQISA